MGKEVVKEVTEEMEKSLADHREEKALVEDRLAQLAAGVPYEEVYAAQIEAAGGEKIDPKLPIPVDGSY